ncbi:MAG TPA: glycine cleavage system protein GcvH [Candidatus Nanopelagicales bacterium]|nr:glycine cleavage system protein GcvH [Candidatus Nanopelagicales bacterium]
MIPGELKYTTEHEWVRRDDDTVVTIGITHYAQDSLGDIVFVSLPAPGDTVSAGQSCGEVESTKSVSELYAPVDGHILEVNSELDANPEVINSAPYGEGWLMKVQMGNVGQFDGLLSASDYEALTQGS